MFQWCFVPLRKTYYVLRYLETELLYKIFVVGCFRNCKRQRDQVLARVECLEPITLTIESQVFTCEDGNWTLGPGMPRTGIGIQNEVKELRRDRKRLRKEVEKYANKTRELKDLKEKLNLLDFKYQLLLDMWTSKVVEGGAGVGASPPRGRSPRTSPTRTPRSRSR